MSRALIKTAMLATVLSSGLAYSSNTELRILNWEDYLADEVIEAWEAETGWIIKQVFFDNEAERDLIIANQAIGGIDLVVVGDEIIGRMGQAGYLAALEDQRDPNLAPRWTNTCDTYGEPYLWGTLGIAYRKDKIDNPPQNWKDLLYPVSAWKGHIGMIGQYDELLGPAMIAMSLDSMTNEEAHLKRAYQLLKDQSQFVLTYEYAPSFMFASEQSSELWVAQVYSGDEVTLNELSDRDVWKYVLPTDGALVWMDCLAIMESSPHKEMATHFLNFLKRPDMNALNSEVVGVATPNLAAQALQSVEFRSSSTTYPSDAVLKAAKRYKPLSSDAIRQRSQIKDALIRFHDPK